MKKFFLVLLAVITYVLIACGCAYFFHGKTIFIMNGVLDAISYLIFNSLFKKISEQKSYEELMKISSSILTTRQKELQVLIEKQTLTWHDIATIAHNSSCWPNLREIFEGKQLPVLINLITISDLKKQIIFSNNLVSALENLNFIAERAYDDEVLKMLTKILHDVEPFIEGKKDYIGTDKLLQLIEAKANILCNFQI